MAEEKAHTVGPVALGLLKVGKPPPRRVLLEHSSGDHDHSTCGHDHSKDVDGKHVHGPGCQHGNKVKRGPRPAQTRAAETGGAAVQFALEDLLPEETDDQGIFDHFEAAVLAHRGVSQVHLRRDAGRTEVCIHHDRALISPLRVMDLARRNGAEMTERYERTTWFVRGLTSADAANTLEDALGRLKGVVAADVAYVAERVVVEYDTQMIQPDLIERAVGELGYELEVPEKGKACSMHASNAGLSPRWQMPFAAVAGALLAIGFVAGAAADADSFARWTYIVALLFAAYFPFMAAVNAIRAMQPDVHTLMILAGIGAGILGAWAEGAFLLFLFTLGHALEHRAMDKARRTIESLGQLTAKTARMRRGADIVEVPVGKVKIGDVVVVRPGDRIPLDGTIVEGQSLIDQATITGESVPVARGPGDKVFAGTINTDTAIELEVASLAGDTLLARIVDMVTEAEAQKSPTQRFVQRLERRFVPIVLVVACVAPIVLIATGMSVATALLRAVSLIVAASPCALAISTPAAVLTAVARAAKGGVLIKGGAHLDALGKVDAIAFDKTGTLTHGKPKLITVAPVEGVAEEELLAIAAGLEGLSSHPLAKAVVEGAKSRGVAARTADACEAIHGKGIRGTVGEAKVQIGNRAMFAGDALPKAIDDKATQLEEAGQTTMFVKAGDRFLGVLGVADTLRDEAKDALAELAQLGVSTTIMLSGDNARVAKAIAGSVGIKEVRAPLLPDGKVDEVRKLASQGNGVAMVGDGVNDAPALAAASVGVAMGGTAADATLETADIVLLDDSLSRLPFAVGLARKATRVVRQNVLIAVGVSAMLILTTLFGIASITVAVVLHEGSTLVVVANGLLLLRYK